MSNLERYMSGKIMLEPGLTSRTRPTCDNMESFYLSVLDPRVNRVNHDGAIFTGSDYLIARFYQGDVVDPDDWLGKGKKSLSRTTFLMKNPEDKSPITRLYGIRNVMLIFNNCLLAAEVGNLNGEINIRRPVNREMQDTLIKAYKSCLSQVNRDELFRWP